MSTQTFSNETNANNGNDKKDNIRFVVLSNIIRPTCLTPKILSAK